MEKKPYIAALISVIYPGLGHLYAGKTKLSIFLIILTTSFIAWKILIFIAHSVDPFSFNPYNFFWIGLYWILVALAAYRTVYLQNAKFEEKEGKVGINDEESFICPQCMQENVKDTEECVNCGKNLREVMLYSDGSGWIDYPDVEINRRSIIEYQKNLLSRRNGKSEQYMINNIKNVEIGNKTQSYIHFIYLSFQYDKGNGNYKKKILYIREEMGSDLLKVMETRKIPFNMYK